MPAPKRLLPPGMVGNLTPPDRALVPVGEQGHCGTSEAGYACGCPKPAHHVGPTAAEVREAYGRAAPEGCAYSGSKLEPKRADPTVEQVAERMYPGDKYNQHQFSEQVRGVAALTDALSANEAARLRNVAALKAELDQGDERRRRLLAPVPVGRNFELKGGR